jgi:hypothetical protein
MGRMNQIDLMSDADCTAFLQWALPRLNLRWPAQHSADLFGLQPR